LNAPVPATAIPTQQVGRYYFVYEFEHMIELMNTTLQTAFTTLGGLVALPTGAEAPYFEYNAETQLISLIAQRSFYDTALASPIEIHVNTPLFKFIQGIDIFYVGNEQPNGKDQLLYVRDTIDNHYEPNNMPVCNNYQGGWNANTNTPALASGVGNENEWYIVTVAGATILDGNGSWLVGEIAYFFGGVWNKYPDSSCLPKTYFKMEQQFNALNNWYDFRALVITTDMPVIREYVPESGAQLSSNQTVAGTVARAILTSFNPNLVRAGDNRGTLVFASKQYRFIDFSSHTPLYQVGLRIWWQDRENNLYPVQVAFGEEAQIKLVFIRKSLEK
jgi:hypothetical protein